MRSQAGRRDPSAADNAGRWANYSHGDRDVRAANRGCRGRDFAAWLGLVPVQHSTGGKQILGKTSEIGAARYSSGVNQRRNGHRALGLPERGAGRNLEAQRASGSPMFEKPRLRERANSRSSRLVYVGEEGEVFLNHAPGELRDICLVEIIGSLEIDFLNVEELSVPFDFVANVVAVELGPSL